MAELSTFPEEHVHPAPTYQRLSIMALASVLVVGPYLAVLGWLAFLDLRDRTPLILPVWVQMIPVLSAALAIISLVLIRRSEGVLAGRRLALVALWLCVLISLAYWAYFAATYLAIRQQADVFVQNWLRKLAAGQTIPAFLDAMPPQTRMGIDPEDVEAIDIRFNATGGRGKGGLDSFRDSDVVRMINGCGNELRITPLGVRSWDYDKNSFSIIRSYRLSVPEATIMVELPAIGTVSQTREFQGRGWSVFPISKATITNREPTQLGENLTMLVREAGPFLNEWWGNFGKRDFFHAYLMTRETTDRQRLHRDFAAHLVMSACAAGTLPPVAVPQIHLARWLPAFNDSLADNLYLPGYYESFTKAGLFEIGKLRTDDQKMKDTILGNIAYLTGTTADTKFTVPDPQAVGFSSQQRWKFEKGRVILPLDCIIGTGSAGRAYNTVATQAIALVEGPEKPAARGSKSADWRVLQVELISGRDKVKMMMQRMRAQR